MEKTKYEALKTLLNNENSLTELDAYRQNDVLRVHGVMTNNFKHKETGGICARSYLGIEVPKIGKKYKVKFGDPIVFKARYVGELSGTEVQELLTKYPIELAPASEAYDVFKQGAEGIICGENNTEIIKRAIF